MFLHEATHFQILEQVGTLPVFTLIIGVNSFKAGIIFNLFLNITPVRMAINNLRVFFKKIKKLFSYLKKIKPNHKLIPGLVFYFVR